MILVDLLQTIYKLKNSIDFFNEMGNIFDSEQTKEVKRQMVKEHYEVYYEGGTCDICSKCGGGSTSNCDCAKESFYKSITRKMVKDYLLDKQNADYRKVVFLCRDFRYYYENYMNGLMPELNKAIAIISDTIGRSPINLNDGYDKYCDLFNENNTDFYRLFLMNKGQFENHRFNRGFEYRNETDIYVIFVHDNSNIDELIKMSDKYNPTKIIFITFDDIIDIDCQVIKIRPEGDSKNIKDNFTSIIIGALE